MEEWQGAELGPPLLPVPPEVAAQLTNDIWANVFRKLRLPALARLQCVCRTWRALSKATHVPETCRVNATQVRSSAACKLGGLHDKRFLAQAASIALCRRVALCKLRLAFVCIQEALHP